MRHSEWLSIFYDNLIQEAATGKVDCYMKYNLIFNTKIPEKDIEILSNCDNEDLLVPTLFIKNQNEFDSLLVTYIKKALEFYDDSNFVEEILSGEAQKEGKGISKEKVIMTLLWSNATIEDFNEPCSYLRKRIAFFELGDLETYKKIQLIGYSDILESEIGCYICKNKIGCETPYSLQIFLKDQEAVVYEFPRIYFGIADEVAYFYAIQNYKQRFIEENKGKKIERKMYKVNEGLDDDDLKDITTNFLVAANIMMGLLKHHNINEFNIASILVSRWNAKIMILDYKRKRLEMTRDYNEEKIQEIYDSDIKIQKNLTDKFLRTFRRLGYHHSSVEVKSYPMEIDSNLHMMIYNQEDICNNPLLEETFQVCKSNSLKK